MEEKIFTLESDYSLVGPAIDEMTEYLSNEHIEQHILNAVTICLTEALNNVIKHSYNAQKGYNINVNVKLESNLLSIDIIDEGNPRTNLNVRDLNFDPEDIDNLPESGMGLYIIKQLMDEMSYYSLNGKNYFSLKKWLY